jgi:hypothetical protein
MQRSRLISRWIILPLALGFITTIAVAWSLAAWLPQKNWQRRDILTPTPERFSLFATEFRACGAMRREWKRSGYSDDIYLLSHLSAFEAIEDPRHSTSLDDSPRWPRWGDIEAVRIKPEFFPAVGCEHATGWPALAAWYSMRFDRANAGRIDLSIRGGVHLPHEPSRIERLTTLVDVPRVRALPLRPIWPGLILDTLFYATAWLIPRGGIRAARRWSRRHRARCGPCGYNLAGLPTGTPCPECGHRPHPLSPWSAPPSKREP